MICLTFLLMLLVSPSKPQDFYSRARNFSLELIYFTQQKTNGHVVLAPFCLWNLLGQITFTAEGDTKNQLMNTIITNRNPDLFLNQLGKLTSILERPSDGVKLITKNYVFGEQTLNLSSVFVTRVRKLNGKIWYVDFSDLFTPRLSNSIIKSSIEPSIPVFGASDFNNTDLIFSNVFIFKANWSTPFNRSNTFSKNYFDTSGKSLGFINTMNQEMRVPHSDIKEMKVTVTELPFGSDGKYCMLILKPYQGVTITEVYRKFASITFKNIFDRLQSDFNDGGVNVTVEMPRFEMQSFLVLNAPLIDMGTRDIFSPDEAKFLNLSLDELYVETIEQRAKISVSEEGVDAFATIPANLEIATKINTYAGQPFIFFIVNKPTMTIVMGGIHGRQ